MIEYERRRHTCRNTCSYPDAPNPSPLPTSASLVSPPIPTYSPWFSYIALLECINHCTQMMNEFCCGPQHGKAALGTSLLEKWAPTMWKCDKKKKKSNNNKKNTLGCRSYCEKETADLTPVSVVCRPPWNNQAVDGSQLHLLNLSSAEVLIGFYLHFFFLFRFFSL